MRLAVFGDGDRDLAAVPRLVERILKLLVREVQPTATAWVRLHGKGYRSKILYFARQDSLRRSAERSEGVVAVVDRDKDPNRQKLQDLSQGRERVAQEGYPLPIAIGRADPHGEAWLLDDPVAIRRALSLPANTSIPTVRDAKQPKAELERLMIASPRSGEVWIDLLGEIASQLDPARCVHAKETGFHHFAEDVKAQLRPLIPVRQQP